MASFYNTGLSHADPDLIHLPGSYPDCCLLASDSCSLAQAQAYFSYILHCALGLKGIGKWDFFNY